jgi:glucan biosynthesis protein C
MEINLKNNALPIENMPSVKAGAISRPLRAAYIDVIRMVLTVLVIMVHAAVTYGSAGDWTYIDNRSRDEMTAAILTFFVIDCQAFFMALFFFFAGYFTPGSFDRKGVVRFWQDRLMHIGIPMLVYTFLLSRIPNYLDEVANHGLDVSLWQFSLATFISDADEGPTWFLFALLLFTLAYSFWRALSHGITRFSHPMDHLKSFPSTQILLITGLLLGLVMFGIGQIIAITDAVDVFGIFSLLVAFFPFYITLFIGGILAYRNGWLEKIPANLNRFWSWLSLGLIVFLPAFIILTGAMETGIEPYLTGWDWRCAVMCLWLGISCIAFSITLTICIKNRVSPANRLAALAAPNTFTVYLIHPLVLVAVTVLLSPVGIHPLVKFITASMATVTICYMIAPVLRRLPPLRSIL